MNPIRKHPAALAVILILSLLPLSSIPLQTAPVPADDAPAWVLVSDNVTATVYNAVISQCNDNPLVTASRFVIIPENIETDRILAMERTMMTEFGIQYGDIIMVEGTTRYDGLWQVQDTMNKRFAGQHKIDFLVPNHIRTGKWTSVKVYVQKPKKRFMQYKDKNSLSNFARLPAGFSSARLIEGERKARNQNNITPCSS